MIASGENGCGGSGKPSWKLFFGASNTTRAKCERRTGAGLKVASLTFGVFKKMS